MVRQAERISLNTLSALLLKQLAVCWQPNIGSTGRSACGSAPMGRSIGQLDDRSG